MIDPLLDLRTVCALLGGVHRATVYRLVESRDLPPPVKIGTRSAWPESEIAALIERRKRGRIAGCPQKAA